MLVQNYVSAVAGKSGGHIIPAVSILKKESNPTIFFSNNNLLDRSILEKEEIDFKFFFEPIELPKFSFKFDFFKSSFSFIKNFCLSFFQSFRVFNKFKIQKLITTGGICSLPVCFAAKIKNIKIELYELNAVPGKASKILGIVADKVFVTFSECLKYFDEKKVSLFSYPVRYEQSIIRNNKSDIKTILVLGGSQGCKFFNEDLAQMLSKLKNVKIIHQTGSKNNNTAKIYSEKSDSIIFDFDNDLSKYYNQADLVISRAGAGSIFENIFFKKKFILIPLESTADDHQLYNALACKKDYPEYCTVLRQADVISFDFGKFVDTSLN